MIEQLFHEEKRYGEPAFSQLDTEIVQLRETMKSQLDSSEKAMLEQLEALYIRQSSAMLRDAYADGFSTGLKLLLEALLRR